MCRPQRQVRSLGHQEPGSPSVVPATPCSHQVHDLALMVFETEMDPQRLLAGQHSQDPGGAAQRRKIFFVAQVKQHQVDQVIGQDVQNPQAGGSDVLHECREGT